MLKLKHLFDNRDLALMLLGNWEYDRGNMEILDQFRISANAVYPFLSEGNVCFLRFAPVSEKQETNLQAELHFMEYLAKYGYPAARIVKTKDHKPYIRAATPWGEYLAIVTRGVGGTALSQMPYSAELYFGYGKALGKLHALSKHYKAGVFTRPDWEQRLDWSRKTLIKYSAPDNAVREADMLLDFFRSAEINDDNFGLIHYDFELDNVFYDSGTQELAVIDFDDSVYHWFAMDIEQSLASIRDEIPREVHERAESDFLTGYRTESELSMNSQALFPACRRYAELFGYARCLRSVCERWENEPEWMMGVRSNLGNLIEDRQRQFGRDLRM